MWKMREVYCVVWAGVEGNGRGFRDAQTYKNEIEALNFITKLQLQDNIYYLELQKRVIWDKR